MKTTEKTFTRFAICWSLFAACIVPFALFGSREVKIYGLALVLTFLSGSTIWLLCHQKR